MKDSDSADLYGDDMTLPLLTSNSGAGGAKTASRTHKGANLFKSLHPQAATRKTKLGWAFSGKNCVMKQLSEFKWLSEKLSKLLPPVIVNNQTITGSTVTATTSVGGEQTGNAATAFPFHLPRLRMLTVDISGAADPTTEHQRKDLELFDGRVALITLQRLST